MHILLLVFYGLLCSYGIVKMRFIRDTGIRPVWLLLFFFLHVGAGWLHNAIAYRYFPGHGDIWDYFWKSFLYRHRLLSDFDAFRADNSTWTYFSHNGVIFIQMLLDLLSFDHMDVNTLLFAFPVFLGSVALFRTFRSRFPDDLLTALSIFLLPSVLFWTSCIFREGVLYMLLGFLLLGLHRLLTRPSPSPARTSPGLPGTILSCLLCFILIAYFRIAIAFTLLVPILAWWMLEKPAARRRLLLLSAAVAGLSLLCLFLLPGFSLPQEIARRQQEFYLLQGHSRLWLPAISGSWQSLLKALPAAALNGLFQPLPGAGGQPIYLAFSLELSFIWLIALLALIRYGTNSATSTPVPARLPFNTFCLLFTAIGLLSIGLIVPFAGTIVRYRSIFLPFLLAPFLHSLRSLRPLQNLNTWLAQNMLNKL